MTSLAGVHYDGQVPLDLRVRRDQLDNDRFVAKGSSACPFPSGGALVEEADHLRGMRETVLRMVKQEKETDYNYDSETVSFHYSAKEELYIPPQRMATEANAKDDKFFKFINQEKGRIDYAANTVHLPFPAEREFYPDEAGNVHDINTVKKESETDESYFKPNGEKFPFANDFHTKVEENSSDEETLIVDLNLEEKYSPVGKKRLDRSNSNCSTNSASSYTSDSGDDIKAFLRPFSSPFKTHECVKCKSRFADLYTLFEHLDGHVSQNPGERFLKCPVCSRKFQNMLGVNAHIRKMHLGSMGFVCQFCQSSFKYNLHLQKHESSCRRKKRSSPRYENCN